VVHARDQQQSQRHLQRGKEHVSSRLQVDTKALRARNFTTSNQIGWWWKPAYGRREND